MRRTKPARRASDWRQAARRTRRTGCVPTTGMRGPFSRSVAPLLEQQPAARPFFARRRRKLTIEGTPFVLADGRIDLADEETNIDPESMLRVFAEIAEQGRG